MFRFTIRDVLWLTVVVAIGVGWWIDHGRIETERARWRRVSDAFEAKFREVENEQREDYSARLQKSMEVIRKDMQKSLEEGRKQQDLLHFPPEPLPANAL